MEHSHSWIHGCIPIQIPIQPLTSPQDKDMSSVPSGATLTFEKKALLGMLPLQEGPQPMVMQSWIKLLHMLTTASLEVPLGFWWHSGREFTLTLMELMIERELMMII